tara:strand:+ start:1084 stop:1275 length:192 start_codon:yes stop_codon:yes gene_type:complete
MNTNERRKLKAAAVDDEFDITRFDATPVAKQMMKQYDIDPASVSAPSGRITVADVKRHIKNKE